MGAQKIELEMGNSAARQLSHNEVSKNSRIWRCDRCGSMGQFLEGWRTVDEFCAKRTLRT